MSDEKQAKKPKQEIKQNGHHVFKGQNKVIHELYKLEVANALKNQNWNSKQAPHYLEVEHVHFFHSVDSAGVPQDTCSPIAHHFHILKKVKEGTEAEHAEFECSPPMVWGMNGQQRVARKIAHDKHTHNVKYVRSQIIDKRKINAEAVQVQVADAQKLPQVPGVESPSYR